MNGAKDAWRAFRAPFVFAAVAFALNLVGSLLDWTDIADPIAHLLYYTAWAAFLAIAAWISFSYTGQHPELMQQMDAVADKVWHTGKQAGVELLTHAAHHQAGRGVSSGRQEQTATQSASQAANAPGLRQRRGQATQ